MTSKNFISYATQCVLIALFTDFALEMLWGHVRRGANIILRLIGRVYQRCRDTEVGKEGLAFCIKENIFRFQVAVDNVLLMSVVERFSNLCQDGQSFFYWQRMRLELLDTATQRSIGSIFCHQVREVFIDTYIQNR